MPKNICYKVVWKNETDNENIYYQSAIINYGYFLMDYKVGEWTETKNKNFPLLVFKTRQDAVKFRGDLLYTSCAKIFKCTYDTKIPITNFCYPEKLKIILTENDVNNTFLVTRSLACLPEGTFGVSKVKLLEDVTYSVENEEVK